MNQLLSPKQLAVAIGASESSLKRWCDQGLLKTVKTAGGHRRIPVQEALRFVREHNHTVVEPRILALPASEDRKSRRLEGCADRMADALLGDNEAAVQAIVLDLYLAGQPVSHIFDDVLAVAFRAIGDKWECREAEIYQERNSCEIALRVLHELRSKLVPPDPGYLALGATIERDQYALPVTMAEIVLRSAGWDARSLGSSIPMDSMIQSIQRRQPKLFWLSVSHLSDEAEFIAGFNRLFEAASQSNTAIVIGGRALTSVIRGQLRYSAFCDTMRHLEEYGMTLFNTLAKLAKKPRGSKTKK